MMAPPRSGNGGTPNARAKTQGGQTGVISRSAWRLRLRPRSVAEPPRGSEKARRGRCGEAGGDESLDLVLLGSLALDGGNRVADLGGAMVPHPAGVAHAQGGGLTLGVGVVRELVCGVEGHERRETRG